MKETKPYWYHNTAYSMEPYFVYLDFPNLVTAIWTAILVVSAQSIFIFLVTAIQIAELVGSARIMYISQVTATV